MKTKVIVVLGIALLVLSLVLGRMSLNEAGPETVPLGQPLPTQRPLPSPAPGDWTAAELAAIRRLTIGTGSLAPPVDSTNPVATSPAAAALGQHIFFDPRLSRTGTISCATCHQPERYFTDGLLLAQGIGPLTRNTPTIVGTAFNNWFFWDGRKDSQWSQALAPLENAAEHGGTRTQYVHVIQNYYQADYEVIFGPLPDFADRSRFPEQAGPEGDAAAQAAWASMSAEDQAAATELFVNIGYSLAAYERLLLPGPSRFDEYAVALSSLRSSRNILTDEELQGLRLFIGSANCTNCHSGPLFSNGLFHNVGVPMDEGLLDEGRAAGSTLVLADPFNCLSPYSSGSAGNCFELSLVNPEEAGNRGAFKTPSLRNVAATAPYMHAGQLATLSEVIEHYSEAPPAIIGFSEVRPLNLTTIEKQQLEAFLRTLSAPVAAPEALLRPN